MSTKENTFKNLIGKNGRALGSLGYFIILMLVFLIGAPEVMMRPNLHQSVFVMLPVIMFMVIPLVFLVTAGEIDLSFASTFGLSAYIFALLLKAGLDPLLCILIGILSGAVVGILMGCLVVYGRLSSLVASLGALFFIRGFLFVASDSKSISFMEISDHWIYDVLVGKLFGVPMQVYWAALFTIFSYYLYRKHVFGIHIHHVGDNPDSAAQMGINVNWVRISAFMYVGLGAALAGIFSCLITVV